jgi:prepilin-type N-terminal cleavage/methylation domain-containing protein
MKKISSQSGFSLVETLVAITILLLVIVGPLSITTNAARSTSFANEQVTAFFMAQEGLEIVQKYRDDLFLTFYNTGGADPWVFFTSTNGLGNQLRICNTIVNAAGCGLYLMNSSVAGDIAPPTNCSTASCLVRYNPAQVRARFTQQTNILDLTKYTRVIRVQTDVTNPNQAKVTSTVTWRTGSIREEQSVLAETYLYNTL